MRTSSGDGALSGLTKEERQKPRGQIGHAENSLFLEENYEQWRIDPTSVDANWQSFAMHYLCEQGGTRVALVRRRAPSRARSLVSGDLVT